MFIAAQKLQMNLSASTMSMTSSRKSATCSTQPKTLIWVLVKRSVAQVVLNMTGVSLGSPVNLQVKNKVARYVQAFYKRWILWKTRTIKLFWTSNFFLVFQEQRMSSSFGTVGWFPRCPGHSVVPTELLQIITLQVLCIWHKNLSLQPLQVWLLAQYFICFLAPKKCLEFLLFL